MSAGLILTGSTSGGDLSQEIFMEVKEAFDRVNIFLPLVESKTIENGSSAQFVISGKDNDTLALTQGRDVGNDTQVGTDISVNPVNMDERIIAIDNLIYDARRIDGKEEKIAHYDVRGPITKMIGTVLAQKIDKTIVAQLGLACEAAGLAGNPDAAAVVVDTDIVDGATAKAKGDAFVAAAFEAVAQMRTNDVYGDPVIAVGQLMYSYLAQSDLINKDYTNGNGGLDSGVVEKVAGANLVTTNHLASASNIEGIAGLVFTSEAVGVVNLIGLQTESNYDFNKFATLISGRYALGCGVLRPECAVAIAAEAQA